MKRKKSVVLLLSLSCATTTIGYASWVANYYYNYVQTNKVQDVPVAYIIGKEYVKYTTIVKASVTSLIPIAARCLEPYC